jgi:hypothetical protein
MPDFCTEVRREGFPMLKTPVFILFTVIFMAAISVHGSKASDEPSVESNHGVESELQEIIVWKVGDPHKGETPDTDISPNLEKIAGKMGFRFVVRAFPAIGFAQQFFDAFNAGEEPDILAINNYGIIDGIRTALGDFIGIGSDPTVREKLVKVSESFWGLKSNGWEFLVTSSKHADAAASLALRSFEYDLFWGFIHTDYGRMKLSPLSNELQEIVPDIALAFLQGDRAVLAAFEDRERLHTDIQVPKQFNILKMKILGKWGNARLAFVPVVSIHKSANQWGRISLLLILRKQDGQWKLLAASTDPISTSVGIRDLAKLLRQSPASAKIPLPAKLLAPKDGQFPEPPQGQRFGNFFWQPSTSSDIVAQVFEFAYGSVAYGSDVRLLLRVSSDDSRPVPWEFPKNNQISAGVLGNSGHNRWRVWSISDSGTISFSDSRSFIH